MNPYQANKALMYVSHLRMLRKGMIAPPIHVHFVISDLCNQNCSFCAYRMDGYTELFAEQTADGKKQRNPHRQMPYHRAKRLLLELADVGVEAIEFTGGGEPTIHPHCADLINYAHDRGLSTALVTNGQKMDAAIQKAVMASTWVRISIDAASEQTYSQMRHVSREIFAIVLKRSEELIRLREHEQSDATIGMGFVVNRDNWREIIDAVKIAQYIGFDNIRFGGVFSPHGAAYYEGFYDEAAAMCQEAVRMSSDKCQVISTFALRMDDLAAKHPDYTSCPYQQLVPYIGADLNVYRCCVLAYRHRGLIGSVAKQSFGDLWYSLAKMLDLREFDARQCPPCQWNDKNRYMNSLADATEIPHVAFI